MSDKAYEWIEYKLTDGVATITFIAPQFNNALGLSAGVSRRAVPRRGGRRGRRGGGHGARQGLLRRFQSQGNPGHGPRRGKVAAHFRVLAMWWHQILHLFTRMPKPILAAVNGVAAGSGLGMTLCADMAVCKDSELLSAWHTIGIANDATTSYSLAKIVGFRHAMEWMMTNRTVYAREALSGTS